MAVMVEERPVVEGPETLSQFWPHEDRPLTVDDLRRQPDDGNRYELVDGVLQVSPAPFDNHQRVVARLQVILSILSPAAFEVLPGPGINLAEDLHRIPDIAVRRAAPATEDFLDRPPVLAIEVASRSTAKLDRTTKKREYAKFGIEFYWIVVPNLDRTRLTAFELHGNRYKEVAVVTGDEAFEAARPFPLKIVPRLLAADGEEWRSLLGLG